MLSLVSLYSPNTSSNVKGSYAVLTLTKVHNLEHLVTAHQKFRSLKVIFFNTTADVDRKLLEYNLFKNCFLFLISLPCFKILISPFSL